MIPSFIPTEDFFGAGLVQSRHVRAIVVHSNCPVNFFDVQQADQPEVMFHAKMVRRTVSTKTNFSDSATTHDVEASGNFAEVCQTRRHISYGTRCQ